MQLTLQYFDGCQGWTVARDRLVVALDRVGLGAEAIAYEKVESLADARRLAFTGSPTILVNGTDPFAPPDAVAALACRVYQNAAGPDQAPSVEQLVDALTRGRG
ncbi:MAG TPA: thioredoxin family protein [Acidimicrobiales bacterium]|jgi:hypothetical protein|nr:thioredoxin family protein [Acidimicrobiales bacterium]